jgi:hypothetical protein
LAGGGGRAKEGDGVTMTEVHGMQIGKCHNEAYHFVQLIIKIKGKKEIVFLS